MSVITGFRPLCYCSRCMCLGSSIILFVDLRLNIWVRELQLLIGNVNEGLQCDFSIDVDA